jgi:PhzF family phenazine biosynthesis protein
VSLTIWQVDAFADRPFAGNPAAVCILPAPRGERWMQDLAREMNLSETAFLQRRDDGYDLRWFTPAIEVDLCGHATVASAHVLWEEGFLRPEEEARFHSRSGRLSAAREGEWIELDFPGERPRPIEPPRELLAALGAAARFTGEGRLGRLTDFVELESEAALRGLKPDLALLRTLKARATIVTARSASPEFDYVCRFFAPAAGVDEDPVTGSAQCVLGPYWQERLGKDELRGYQASARGGVLRVRPRGDRVRIAGKAVTVLKGELLAP